MAKLAFFLLSLAMFAASGATALVLECDFKHHKSYWGLKYTCVAKNLETTLSDRTVTSVTGSHLEMKDNDDVKKILIEQQNCPYLPNNLGSHFKNLEILYVMHSNVSHLTDVDLAGLKLRIFDISYNPVTQLHKDYFKGQGSIEIISFYDCELESVEKGVLDPLVNLKEGHFQFNPCVDYRGDDERRLTVLRRELKYCDRSHGPRPSQQGNNAERSFLRSNVYVITSILLVVILALLVILYKLNAFNKQNWR